MKLTERQQLTGIIVSTVAALLLAWHFILGPQNRRRDRLENEIRQIAASLQARNMLHEEAPLRNKLYQEEHRIRGLSQQWLESAERLSGFPDHQSLERTDVARVDYKAALFAVRKRLLAKSDEIGIPLPHELGVEDAVTTDEDIRIRMLQLRTAERLADLALDLRIAEIQHIEPMQPIRHRISENIPPHLEEYPVRLVFHGSMANLNDLFRATLRPEHVFFFRNLRIDRRLVREQTEQLRIDAVISALFFLRDADHFDEPAAAEPLQRIPW